MFAPTGRTDTNEISTETSDVITSLQGRMVEMRRIMKATFKQL